MPAMCVLLVLATPQVDWRGMRPLCALGPPHTPPPARNNVCMHGGGYHSQVQQAIRGLATSMLHRKGGCHLARATIRPATAAMLVSRKGRPLSGAAAASAAAAAAATSGAATTAAGNPELPEVVVSLTDVAHKALQGACGGVWGPAARHAWCAMPRPLPRVPSLEHS